MIEMRTEQGYTQRIVEYNDLMIYMNNNFKMYFDTYLLTNYGITEETFRKAIKTLVPEEFI